MTNLDTLTIARDRGLGLEAHRVLRCLEQNLSFEQYEPVDSGAMARMLEMRPQAISRALRVLTERGIIARGAPIGRAGTFRFTGNVAALPVTDVDAVLRSAQEVDLERLARAGSFSTGYGREDLRKDIAAGRCWVLVAEGAIVGQLAIRKDPSVDMAYLLARLLVDRRYRRLGLGQRLLAAMERSLEGNRIHAYCPVSDPEFLKFLIDADFVLSGYVKGRDERETRLFFGKVASTAVAAAMSPPKALAG
jgi:GNAT superfamily N-acetyltransferase